MDEDILGQDTPTPDTQETTAEPLTLDAMRQMLADERAQIRSELLAELKPKEEERQEQRDPQTITPYEVSDAWEGMMEDIEEDFDDLPKDVRKSIRDELRDVARRENVTPMGIRESGYHKKVALAHVEKAVRAKSYVPQSWGLPTSESGKSSAPKPPEKRELDPVSYITQTAQNGEVIDMRQILSPKEIARAEKRLAAMGNK